RLSCAPGTVKSGICWRDVVNPTKEHEELAEKHRKLAGQHRAASQSLVTAEGWACAGLDDDDRDMSPFAHAADIRSVSRVQEEVVSEGGPSPGPYTGATIVLQAVPGLSAPWLQRIVDCHLARNAAMGHPTAESEMPNCPLAVNGAHAVVREVNTGFAVDVISSESGAATEIWARAQRLARSGG
ncbi:MAG: hypothetical protein ABI895_13130, partial [Deltaproteobacteria bacterium]